MNENERKNRTYPGIVSVRVDIVDSTLRPIPDSQPVDIDRPVPIVRHSCRNH